MNKRLKATIAVLTCALCIGLTTPKKAFAWDSKESAMELDTHKLISLQALEIIKNDMGNDKAIMDNLKIIEENAFNYRKGTVDPDWGNVGKERDYQLYQDHFFDPDTMKNFTSSKTYLLSEIKDNAESQSRSYFSRAVANWKDGNYSEASYLLGKCLHYIEDLNQPHHALNWIATETPAHCKFEQFMEARKEKFTISTMGEDKAEFEMMMDKPAVDFVSHQCFKYAKKAKTLKPLVSIYNSNEDWEEAGKIGMENAQKCSATIVYRFLQEVSHTKNVKLTAPIGNVHAIISVEDEKSAGTDDYIYFGLVLKDGRKIEFNCDLPGNDFERGTTGGYQFSVDDENIKPQDISKVYLRKARSANAAGDVKFKSLEVYMQGQRIAKEEMHKWLSGNATYEVNCNIK
ncbi:zinc dependent phospholipase C family protein [Clostridium tarantellae]|uniref:Phospholipase C n=1 Tax=Clostridium tarantellae TaxID=39493 RepID=A0A6I1MPC2_9CLOT|nr:zinc dependent phospholipase C family protein [Clostridium tarantellae]MPQ44318.1 hypothetical protein [Clostridium tarantellae]